MTDCEDRSHLSQEVRAAIRRLGELCAEQFDAWRRHEPVNEAYAKRIREAVEIAERARIALEQHTQAHRCSDDPKPAAG